MGHSFGFLVISEVEMFVFNSAIKNLKDTFFLTKLISNSIQLELSNVLMRFLHMNICLKINQCMASFTF